MSTSTYNIAGMTCSHCVHAVTEEVGKLDGVQKVDVVLNAGGESQVTITSAVDISLEEVRAAVGEAGYELTGASA